VAGGNNTVALKDDGTVWEIDSNGIITEVPDLCDVTFITASRSHKIAIKSDGTVWAWGYNNYWQIGSDTAARSYNPIQVKGLSDVIAIAAGGNHNIALKSDGTVWTWGHNNHGQLGNETTINSNKPVQVKELSHVIAIAAGANHSLALRNDGVMWAWGYNNQGQLGDGTNINRSKPVISVDTNPPSVPKNLVSLSTDTTVSLSWEASFDGSGVEGYNVYRDGVKIATVTETKYEDTDITQGKTYVYTVTAFDVYGYESEYSNSVINDTEAPTPPTELVVVSKTASKITLSWTASTDNVAVKGYEVFRNDTKVGETYTTSYTDTGLNPDTSYKYYIKAFDISGNYSLQSQYLHEITYKDTTAPSTPSGISLGSSNDTSFELKWNSSYDDVRVAGYEIYRDGVKIGTSQNNKFSDAGVKFGTTYSYTVRAFDSSDNISMESIPLVVTEYGNSIKTAEVIQLGTDIQSAIEYDGDQDFFCFVAPDEGIYTITLHINTRSYDNKYLDLYDSEGNKIYSDNSYNDNRVLKIEKKLSGGETYYIRVSDSIKATAYSIKVTLLSDKESPTTPTDLKVLSKSVASITLEWTESTDNLCVSGYEIFRDGVKVGIISKTDSEARYTDTYLIPGKTYKYTVKAFDSAGNISPASNEVTVKTEQDVIAPSVPQSLRETGKTATSFSFEWEKSTDNAWVKGYEIYRDGIKIDTTELTSYTHNFDSTTTSYKYTVKAYDVSGNISNESETLICDNTPPEGVKDIKIISKTSSSVNLSWTMPEDNVGVKYYEIIRNGSKAGTVTDTRFTDILLKPDTQYTYELIAYDFAGNASEPVSYIVITEKDTNAPSVPVNMNILPNSGTSVTLVWTASIDDIKVAGYYIYRDGEKVGSTVDTTYTDSGLEEGKNYVYTVRSFDTSGNVSEDSKAVVLDRIAPTKPEGLMVVSKSASTITISWTASTDNVEVTEYEVYRDGKKVGTTKDTIYTDNGLELNNTYSYAVKACDAFKNTSEISESIEESTTIDTEEPSAPNGLKISSRTGYTITISWNPSTDNTGVAGYEIYRNEVKVGTTSITYYTDTGLTTGKTYSYTVKAFDASGNISKASIAINGVPLKPEIAKVDPVDMSLFGGAVDQQLRIYCTMSSERSVKKATVEYSTDNINWTTIGNMQGSEATLEDTQYFLFTYYWDIRPLKTGEYKVRYTAYDDAGACESKIVTYEIDKDAPSAPKNLKVVSVYGEVQLSWEVPIDSDVSGYIIYRSDSETGRYLPMQEISGRITCYYTDFAVTDGVTYYYKVMAIDKFGQEGLPSNVVYAKVVGSDIIKPVVKQINPPNGSVIAKSATITVEATDNNMVSTIKLQYSLDKGQTWVDASIGVIQGTNKAQFNWTTPEINGEIMVRAIAVDRAGNESDGEPVRTYIIDRKGPSKVTGLKAIPSSTSIILNWDDVPDADFSYFEVECLDDKGIFNLVGRVSNRRGIVLDGLKPNTSYTYRVCAYDIYGNRGQVSDEICVRTSEDVSIPVVRYLGPASDRYSQSIMLSANIYDDTSIASVLFQVSTDNVNWTDIHYIENSGNNSSFSWNYDVSKLPEGKIYIRCLARDTKGNESSGSPVNEYIIDHTAPAKPSNVQVTTDAGYINLRWTRGNESDLKNYKIYRSVNNGPYSVIQTGYGYLDYTDRNVQANLSYKYRITAVDISGNESEAYETSTVILPKDSTKPQIHSVSYKNNSTLPANPKISVLAEDNYLLESVRMKYRRADSSEEWIVGDIIKGINSYSSVVEFLWNTDELTDGNYEVVFIAKDINGLESDEYKVTYNLNIMPPKATVLKAVPSGWKIELQWDKNTEPDLAGYHILRGNAYDGEFVLIGKTTNTSYIDTKVEAGTTYYYVVESVDKYLNKSRSNIVSGIPTEDDDEKPVAVIKADRFSTTNTYILFDSTASIDNHKVEDVLWDFGDGTQSTEWKAYHKYSEPGDYTVSLAVYDSARNYSTTQHVIRIYDSALTSKVNIQVIDDSTALGLSNADVIVKMPDGSEESFITDESGFIYLLIPFTNEQDIGNLTVYAFTTGYRPAKKEIQVSAGVSNNVVIRIVKDKLVEGELTFRRMTLDEVKAAGLDIKAPENQYVYSFNIHLGYTVVCNSFGQIANNSTYTIREYDSTTNSNKTTNVYVNAIPSKDVKRPPTIVYIELPGDVSMLKEFFMVNLRVKNLAEDKEFVIEDAKAKLNVPSGLTIVKGNAEQNLTPKDIPGGSKGNSSWIVRGDKKGSYNLSADFSGVLQPFDEQISATFTSKNPIVVEEESGLRVIIEVESQKYVNDKLLYRVGLKNERKSDVNMPNISMQNSTLIRRYKTTEDMSLKNTSLEVLKSKEIIWSEFYVNPNVFNGLNNKSLQLVEYAAEALGNEDLPIEIRPVEYGTFGRIKPRIYVIDPVTGIEYECISLDLIRYRSKENDIMPDLKIKTSRGISDGVEVQEVCEIKIVDRVFNVTKIVLTDANGEYIYKGGSIDNVKIEYPGVETYTIEVSADMGITDYRKVRIIDQNLLPKEVFGNVSGYVWNKDNNQPVIGAEVIIGSATTLTGEKGLFEFKDIMLDSDKITVRANGFPEKVEKVELSDGSFVKIDLSILPEITEVRSHYSSSKNKRSSIIPVNIIPDTIYFFIETDLKGDGEVIKYLYKI